MKAKKLNLDDFKHHALLSEEKTSIKGGDTTSPPELDPDGNPVTGSNGGDIKPPVKPIIVFFEP